MNRSRKFCIKLAIALTLCLAIAMLAGCGAAGSEFEVFGRVDHGGDRSITLVVDHTAVDEADWFEDGNTHQIHDNSNDHGAFDSNHTYGHLFDRFGNEIRERDLESQDCVRLIGQIRHHYTGSGETRSSSERPVYETGFVVSCETWT